MPVIGTISGADLRLAVQPAATGNAVVDSELRSLYIAVNSLQAYLGQMYIGDYAVPPTVVLGALYKDTTTATLYVGKLITGTPMWVAL